jgi:hypothetical protein
VALSHAVSGVFAAHGLPRFYDDPRPHVSGEYGGGGGGCQLAGRPACLPMLMVLPGSRSGLPACLPLFTPFFGVPCKTDIC